MTDKIPEDKYLHLFEKSPFCIYITDREGLLLNVNPACLDLLGYASKSAIRREKFQSFFHDPKDWETYLEMMEKTSAVKEFETRLCGKSGKLIDVKISATERKTLTDKCAGYEGYIVDVTDVKRYEKQKHELEEKYRTVLENSLAGTHMFMDGGKFSYVNQQLVDMLGYDNEDALIGKEFYNFVHPDDRELVKQRGLEREKREIYPREYNFRMIKKDGSVIWVNSKATHASYMGCPAVVGNFIDITKIKRAEAQIRRLSRKLIDAIEEERKTLAADLHDEIGQILTSVKFQIEGLEKKCRRADMAIPDDFSRLTESVAGLAGKIRAITSRLRPDLLDHMGLVPTLEWHIDDLKKCVPEIQIDLQVMGFKKRLKEPLETALYRIFQESINNSLKHANADRINIRLILSHPKVIFSCSDNGCGFNIATENPVCDQNMGIGLLSMKERTDAANGTFRVTSRMGKGTVVRVELPIGEEEHIAED